ncbi:phospholipase D-like domain-containing protein [Lysinibacillus capsici]|uniref:phospholipase D-like domain-containing protein n=1 Tax=Lysinibacillus capsici TaxID=2115968 RepID=UPI0027A5E561|nr:phospholipase D-like domain-containing protein [Lysinibacillus boronitolerans]
MLKQWIVNIARILKVYIKMKISFTRLQVLITELYEMLSDSRERLHNIHDLLMKYFPNLCEDEVNLLINLLDGVVEKSANKGGNSEIVITNPLEINHDLRKTIGVIRENILSSKQSILITGYSISEFAKELIDLLTLKSKQGTSVIFLIDKDVEESMFEVAIKSPNFKVYKFSPTKSNTHLHAKVMIFDKKRAFVSSSNLSYNGIINNLEIGILTSDKNVIKLNTVLEEMLNSNYFESLNNKN